MNLINWISVSIEEQKTFKYLHKLIPFLVFEGLLFFVVIFFVNILNLSIPTAMLLSAIIIFAGYGYFMYQLWEFFKTPLK